MNAILRDGASLFWKCLNEQKELRYNVCVKKKGKLPRDLVRHPMPRPTIAFTDKKKQSDKSKCRKGKEGTTI